MRLHQLSFAGIGPFPGQHAIDFTALTRSGLFLLEGPTGAGKSTVIDAIVFALYGGLADKEADKHRLRSDYAAGSDPSFVELVFEVPSGVYKVRRTPAHQRAKRRGEGFTTVNGTAQLWRFTSANDKTGELVSRNAAEASAEIPRIVGLTLEQFSQTVVLPQGRFAAFLRADNDTRKSVLQTIFGTEIYQRLAEELRSRRLEAEHRVESLSDAVRQAVRDLALAAGLDQDGAAGLAAAAAELTEAGAAVDLDPLDMAVGGTVAGAAGALVAAGAAAEAAAKTARLTRAAADQSAALAKAAVTKEELSARLAKLLAGEDSRAEQGRRLEAARRAAAVWPLVEQAEAADLRRREAEAVAVGLGLTGRSLPGVGRGAQTGELGAPAVGLGLATSEPPGGDGGGDADGGGQASGAQTAGALTGREAAGDVPAGTGPAGTGPGEAAPPQADGTRLREEPFQAALDQAALAESKAEAELQAARRLERAKAGQSKAEAARAAAEKAVDLAALASEEAIAAAERHQREAPGLERRSGELERLGGQIKAHQAALKRLKAAAAAQQGAKTAFAAAQEAEVSARNARLAGIAGEMAASLTAGQPCPVCGATDHPALAPLSPSHVTVEDVQAAEVARAAAEAAFEQAAKRAGDAERQTAELAGVTGGADSAEVAQELAETRRQLAELGAPEVLAEAAKTAAEALAECRSALTAAQAAFEMAHDEVVRLSGQTSSQDLAAARAALSGAEKRKRRAADELAAVRRLLEAARDAAAADQAAGQGLSQARFESAEAARAAKLDQAAAKRLSQELEDARVELLSVKQLLEDPALAQVEGEAAELAAAASRDAEAAELAAAEEKAAASQLTLAERVADLTSATAAQTRTAATAYIAAKAQTAPLVRVAELAMAGTRNRPGVDLPTYALIRRFEEVVAAANDRLGPMSSGRYQLERSDTKEAVRQRRTGLALRVRDNHTGEARDPRTLSGGETFYVSLALALGLADQVSAEAGGVGLETLFVDEGFGSLDAESLEAVLAQLARLRDGGRVVGLVSHVEALKQAIPERIEVRPAAERGSTLTVRA